jgi:hypothetical protein
VYTYAELKFGVLKENINALVFPDSTDIYLRNLFQVQTLRKKYGLRVFENRVLRRIFGPKREEVAGGWGRLHNEINNLYASQNIIRVIKSRRMRWVGHVTRMGEVRNACKILVGKYEGKGPLGKPRRSWVDNIQMNFTGFWLRILTGGWLL